MSVIFDLARNFQSQRGQLPGRRIDNAYCAVAMPMHAEVKRLDLISFEKLEPRLG